MFKECIKKVNKNIFLCVLVPKITFLSFKIQFNGINNKNCADCSMKFHLLICC